MASTDETMPDDAPGAARPESRMLPSGTVLADRYVIVAWLATGGMSEVYLARHTGVGRQVALKVLKPEYASDKETVTRFLEEARLAGMLGHPNIVECQDLGYVPSGAPFLVFELLSGKMLRDVLSDAVRIPVDRAVAIAMQCASALEMAHVNHIVHRDFKPENVFIVERAERAEHAKIIDFGISKRRALEGGAGAMTMDGRLLGTPEYMSPEQVSAASQVDARADIWSLGITLYEMLSGTTPFAHIPFPRNIIAVESEPITPLAEVVTTVPRELSDVVMKMLERSLDLRYQDMKSVFHALAPFAGGLAPRHLTAHVVQVASVRPPSMASINTATSHTANAAPAAPPPSRPWLALGLVGVAVVAATAWVLKPAAPPAPAAVVTAAPAAAPTVRPDIALKLVGGPFTKALFRGKEQPLPFADVVKPSEVKESIEVSAPGKVTLRYWVTLDKASSMHFELPTGSGSRDATDAEREKALAEPAAAAPTATGAPPLEPAQIQETVKKYRQQIQACIDAVPGDGEINGVISINAVIDKSGAVVELDANDSTQQPALKACVLKGFKSWRFPSSDGQRQVAYTFKFK